MSIAVDQRLVIMDPILELHPNRPMSKYNYTNFTVRMSNPGTLSDIFSVLILGVQWEHLNTSVAEYLDSL